MARNGVGTYVLPAGNPVVSGSTISSSVQNATMSDVAAALSQSISNDGQTPIVSNLPMYGFRHTGTAAATARTDYAQASQVQDSSMSWLTSVAGTDTITASLTTPTLTAYATGQQFRFVSAGSNTTTSVTLNINGIGAKSVTKNGATALAIGDIPAGAVCVIEYDGTQFQLINVYLVGAIQAQSYTAFTTAGTAPNFTLTPNPAIAAYAKGVRFNVTFHASGTTGSNTINVSGLGNVNLKQYDPNSVKIAAQITALLNSDIVYDGTDFVLLNPMIQNRLPARNNNSPSETFPTGAFGKITASVIGAANITKALPDLSTGTVNNGTVIGWTIESATTGYIGTLTSTQSILFGGTSVTSIPLAQAGDTIIVVADTQNVVWHVIYDGIMGPSFEAATTTTTAMTNNTPTKLAFNSEISDPYNCYDNATNYRFTPLVPGWYEVSITAVSTSSASNRLSVAVYKNGALYQYGSRALSYQSGTYDSSSTIATSVYLNGSTDYIEAYGTITDANGTFTNSGIFVSAFKAVRSR